MEYEEDLRESFEIEGYEQEVEGMRWHDITYDLFTDVAFHLLYCSDEEWERYKASDFKLSSLEEDFGSVMQEFYDEPLLAWCSHPLADGVETFGQKTFEDGEQAEAMGYIADLMM